MDIVCNTVQDVEVFTFLEKDNTWSFDSTTFTAPALHVVLTDRRYGRVMGANLRVCLVPDLVTPSSSCASHQSDISLLENTTASHVVTYVFDHFVSKVEIVRSLVNLWILALLCLATLEEVMELSSSHSGLQAGGVLLVAVRFTATQGTVDLMFEFRRGAPSPVATY